MITSLPIIMLVLAGASNTAVWSRDASDPRTVVGTVDLADKPTEVWAAVAKLENWPRIFSDVRRLKVKERRGDTVAAEIDTRIFDCGPHVYTVRIDEPRRSMSMDIAALGLKAAGRFEVSEGPGGGATVRYVLTVEVRAPASWFADEADVRKKQERMVATYLADVEAWKPQRSQK